MERKITIEFVNQDHRLFPAIYKISFGRKFYIGKSNVPADRMRQHENSINKALAYLNTSDHSGMKRSDYENYIAKIKFATYLNENPSITTGKVEIIQRGIHPISLYYMENFHLSSISDHPDSLNSVFNSGRPQKEDTHFCDAKIVKEKLYLFNPITGNGIWASSVSKSYGELKKTMDAGLESYTYRKYLGSLMTKDYNEDAQYLTQEEKSERLGRIMAFMQGK